MHLFTYQNIFKLKLIFNLNADTMWDVRLNCVACLEGGLPNSFWYLTWEADLGKKLFTLSVQSGDTQLTAGVQVPSLGMEVSNMRCEHTHHLIQIKLLIV